MSWLLNLDIVPTYRWNIKWQDENDNKREEPGHENGDCCDYIMSGPIAVSIQKNTSNGKGCNNLKWERPQRHVGSRSRWDRDLQYRPPIAVFFQLDWPAAEKYVGVRLAL